MTRGRVRVPAQLEVVTAGSAEVEVTGTTVAEMLEDLVARHPNVRDRLFGEDGAPRRFINIYLDDEDIRFLDGLETAVAEGSRLSIVPAIAGG